MAVRQNISHEMQRLNKHTST